MNSENIHSISENYDFALKHFENSLELKKVLINTASMQYENGRITPDDCRKIFESIFGSDSDFISAGFAYFCCKTADNNKDRIMIEDDNDETVSDDIINRIAYTQNAFTDKAYRVFSSETKDMSAVYYPSYREICEEVYNGIDGGAIIPIFNSTDGNLLSFIRLINRYELKITETCDVVTGDDSFVRYALCRKKLPRYTDTDNPVMALSVILSDGDNDTDGIQKLMSCLEACDIKVFSIVTVPVNDTYGMRKELIMMLKTDGLRSDGLRLFLEASRINYNIFGLYKIIGSAMM